MKSASLLYTPWYVETFVLISKEVRANVLKERKPFKTISLRCVGHRRRTKEAKEKVLWALRGFSDFVILDKQYEPVEQSTDKSMVYGAVEAKAVGLPILESNDDILQFVGHLLWFDREINEYLGKFNILELPCDSFILCKNSNDRREWDNREWKKLIKYLNNFGIVSHAG